MMFDLHIHSNYSRDGVSSVPEIVETAMSKNLESIAITDHGPELSVGIDLSDIHALVEEVRKYQGKKSLKIILGMEANIKDRYGNIDINEHVCKQIDFVIGSIHYVREASTTEETALAYLQRVERAITKHRLNVLGHPFFLHRDLFPYVPRDYIEEFLELAAKRSVAMELNVKYRAPNDEFLKLCLRHNVKLSVGSDAHRAEEVGEVRWAFKKLEKLGARKEDLIINYL